jgi:hypothetical protein
MLKSVLPGQVYSSPFDFLIYCPFKFATLKVQKCSAYSLLFIRILRIRQKCFTAVGEYAKSIYSSSEIAPKVFKRTRWKRAILEWFYLHKVISENAKRILPCTENTLKGCKRFRRIRQEYFADGHKSEPISTNFCQKTKNSYPKSPS